MANFVVKKDGTKEPFDAEKIKKAVVNASREAALAEERGNELAEQILNSVTEAAMGKEEITTSEIKEKILSQLDAVEPSVSAAWRKYEQGK